MATVPDTGPIWWDRDVDDQGVPIRTDVRQAAHDLWPEAVKRVRRTLSDDAEAAQLMEDTVLYISRHLDRVQATSFASYVPSLLSLHFSQELRRLAGKRGRIRLVGDRNSIEECATVEGWAERIDRHIDFEKIVCLLNERSRTIVAMRMQDHEWDVIGHKLGMLPATVRRAFWKDLREVLLRMGCRNGSGRKERSR